jgi:hypothetical protein
MCFFKHVLCTREDALVQLQVGHLIETLLDQSLAPLTCGTSPCTFAARGHHDTRADTHSRVSVEHRGYPYRYICCEAPALMTMCPLLLGKGVY